MSPLLPVCPRTGKTATSKTSSTAVFVSLVTRPGAVRHWRGFSEVVIEQCIPFTPQSFCKCWFSFNRRHALGPKDRKLVAPVREDGELHLLIARKARRAGTNRGAPSVLR